LKYSQWAQRTLQCQSGADISHHWIGDVPQCPNIHPCEKSTLKYLWEYKSLQITKEILGKMYNTGGITKPEFKVYYRSIAMKIAQYRHKTRYEDQ
jgi:hypothetical protein